MMLLFDTITYIYIYISIYYLYFFFFFIKLGTLGKREMIYIRLIFSLILYLM